MVKIGVLGTGSITETHLSAYKNLSNVEVVAIAGRNKDKLLYLAGKYDTVPINDFHRLITHPEIEMIDICLPTPWHKEYVVESAKASKHVFCEKPIACNLTDAELMVTECKKSGIKFMVGHVLRFFPNYRTIKQLIDEGKVGRIGTVRASRVNTFPKGSDDWYANFAYSGGTILDLTIHDFDFLSWCFGPVKRVYAVGLAPQGLSQKTDYALVTLKFQTGVIAHIESSWAETTGFSSAIEVAGSKGIINFTMKDSVPLLLSLRKDKDETVKVNIPESPVAENPYLAELRYFVDCIEHNKEPEFITPNEALTSLKIALAAIESVKTGKLIDL